jgi:starch phosphorylase
MDNLFFVQARFRSVATTNDYYQALAYTVRDRLLARWIKTAETYKNNASRTVCYLSAEFLLGPHLGANLLNLGITETARTAMHELGLDLEVLLEQEKEPGLGRLAACYMESLATLQVSAIGYGIRYEFGIFDQRIRDGWQVEVTDKWLRFGNPWEIARPEITYDVKLGGNRPPPRAAFQAPEYPRRPVQHHRQAAVVLPTRPRGRGCRRNPRSLSAPTSGGG